MVVSMASGDHPEIMQGQEKNHYVSRTPCVPVKCKACSCIRKGEASEDEFWISYG